MNRSGPMVVACLAPTDLRPEVDDLTGTVRADARLADLPASESAALEHALRVAEAWDGWVLVVAAAPPEADPVLRGAAAFGAEVVRVDWGRHQAMTTLPGPQPVGAADLAGDPAGLATALATAIRARGTPAMVICGDRSGLHGVGAVPALLAHELGLEQALGLVSLAVDGPRLRVERRLDAGWRERLSISGPAVLSVEAAGVRLRRAGLAAALAVGPEAVIAEPAQVPAWAAGAGGMGMSGTEAAGAGGMGTGGTGPAGAGGVGMSGTGAAGAGTLERARTGPDAGVRFGAPRPYRPRTRPVAAPEGDAHHRLLALTGALSAREPARVVGPVSPEEAADEVLGYLKRFGYLEA